MERIKFVFIALLMCHQAFSQVTLSGNRLVKNGETYKFSQYNEVFSKSEAKELFKKARTNSTVGQVFAYSGGFLIGFGIVPALKGKKQEVRNGIVYENQPSKGWTIVGIGAGLVGISIPFGIAANKRAKEAIEIENNDIPNTAFQPYFKVESTGTGISLSYNF